MPIIKIGEPTFKRLQRHARPLVDSVEDVIARALDALVHCEGEPLNSRLIESAIEVDPDLLPDLTHTKILRAHINGDPIERPNWNRLRDLTLIRAMRIVKDFERLDVLYPANVVPGKKTDTGYRYLSTVEVSVQGLSANEACSAMVRLALQLNMYVDVDFVWRKKDGAAHPGERGRLKFPRTEDVMEDLKQP